LTAVWWWVGFVAVVASGFPVGVDPGGWVERWETVGFDVDVPPVVVDDFVVVSAEQHAVGAGCFAHVFPVVDVMHEAPPRWPVAAGERAALVSDVQGAADAGGGVAAGAADV